jgi:hypothetical protein
MKEYGFFARRKEEDPIREIGSSIEAGSLGHALQKLGHMLPDDATEIEVWEIWRLHRDRS